MRLRRLEIQGFKSFPERSVIEFSNGVTGIVGPNGCGKSNLVDAVRWVLGEQSPKQLRGAAMEDVLFKGGDGYAPANLAEVSLTLENTGEASRDLSADSESDPLVQLLRRSTEVTIVRRYYRSGESEFLINKQACRLRDIVDLFAICGIRSGSYAIIEQGRIERLVLARPEERRVFIEDAAGTAIYRSRRLAAQRRMERARENLARISDLLQELERQVAYLRRLLKRSEQSRAMREELRSLGVALAFRQYLKLKQAHEDLRAQLASAETECAARAAALESVAREVREATDRLRRLDQELRELEVRQERLRAEISATQAQKQLLDERAHLASARIRALEEERTRIRDEIVSTDAGLRGDVAQRGVIWSQLLKVERVLAEQERQEKKLRRLLDQLRARREERAQQREKIWRQEVEARNRVERNEKEAALLRRTCEELERELQSLGNELVSIDAELLRLKIAQCRVQKECDRYEREAAGWGLRLSEQQSQLEEVEAHLTSLRERLLQTESRLAILEELRRSYEGYPQGARALLEDRAFCAGNGIVGTVVDILSVPEHLERAVAAALGSYLHGLIVDSPESSIEVIRVLRERGLGRGYFIARQARALSEAWERVASLNGASAPLLRFVGVDAGYEDVARSLLGPVVVAPSLQEGIRLWEEVGGDVAVVTAEGDLIDRQGVVAGGFDDRNREAELLARKRLLSELAAVAQSLREELRLEEERYVVRRREWEELRAHSETAQAALRAARSELVHLRREVEGRLAERQKAANRIEQRTRQFLRLRSDEKRVQKSLADARASLGSLSAVVSELEQSASFTEGIEELERQVASLRDVVGRARIRVAELQHQHDSAVRNLSRRERELQRLALREREAALELERQRSLEAGDSDKVRLLHSHVEKLSKEFEEVAARCLELHAQRREAEQKVSQLERHKTQLAEERERSQDLRGRTEIALAQLAAQMSQLTQDNLARFGEGEAIWAEVSRRYEHLDADELQRRMAELQRSVERLGDIGSATEVEFEELRERVAFLQKQREDIQSSLRDLEDTIQRLDRTSRERFVKTFGRVAESFAGIVPRLFGGGEARLVMVKGLDEEEEGVEMLVRPPGKRLESVGLLSGGEKALVSLAFLFAIFEANPAPFCILDEVDAPLDDANVARFSQLVRTLSTRVQVLVVTHNKRTMVGADRLYGVTMQTPGVSSLLSVSLS